MNRIRFQAMWFTLSLSIAFPSHAAEQKFVSLFDGKTLDGWTINCPRGFKPLTFGSGVGRRNRKKCPLTSTSSHFTVVGQIRKPLRAGACCCEETRYSGIGELPKR
jgi:hypothetical protein